MKSRTVRYDSLAAMFEEIGNKGAKGAVVAGVVLTYEFDPELVKSLAYQGLLAYDANAERDEPLRWAGAFPVALFFDPKRAHSLGRTPGNFEIHFITRDGWGAHHPKAYALALRDGSFELVLGSFNFTSSGVYENRELLLRFSLTGETDGKPDAEALRMHLAWRDFLRSTYGSMTHSPALEDYLRRLDARLEALEWDPAIDVEVPPLRFVPSGYEPYPNGFETLREYAEALHLKPTRLLIVSPFFDSPDRRGEGVLERFFGRDGFPTLKHVSVFSSHTRWNPSYFKKVERLTPTSGRIRCFSIPNEISNAEAEVLDKYFGRDESGFRDVLKKRRLFRALHAKAVVLVEESGLGLFYIGSANFSAKAWLGGNAETGVAGKIFLGTLSEDWDKNLVMGLLGVCPKRAPLEDDAPMPESDPEDEDDEIPALPAWLESVSLAKVDKLDADLSDMRDESADCSESPDQARFVYQLRCGSKVDELGGLGRFLACEIDVTPIDYIRVQNMDGMSEMLVSAPLTMQEVVLLLQSARTLSWRPEGAEAEQVRYIPFNIDPTVGVRSEWAASVAVDVSEGLSFLHELLEGERPRVRTDTTNVGGSEANLPVKHRDGVEMDADDVRRPSLTHVMREWISNLDRLESVLFDEKGRAIVARSDLYIYLSEYARRLAAPEACIAGRLIAGVPQRFAIAELLGLVSRYALATVRDGRSERRIKPEDAARICDIREQLANTLNDDSTEFERNVIEGYLASIDGQLRSAGVIGDSKDE